MIADRVTLGGGPGHGVDGAVVEVLTIERTIAVADLGRLDHPVAAVGRAIIVAGVVAAGRAAAVAVDAVANTSTRPTAAEKTVEIELRITLPPIWGLRTGRYMADRNKLLSSIQLPTWTESGVAWPQVVVCTIIDLQGCCCLQRNCSPGSLTA